jgi:hypothetical protein
LFAIDQTTILLRPPEQSLSISLACPNVMTASMCYA